jgi:hypothetical protein
VHDQEDEMDLGNLIETMNDRYISSVITDSLASSLLKSYYDLAIAAGMNHEEICKHLAHVAMGFAWPDMEKIMRSGVDVATAKTSFEFDVLLSSATEILKEFKPAEPKAE